MTISQVITALPDAPNPATMTATEFSNAAAASVLAQKAMTPELNTFGTQANALAVSVNADATAAAGSAAAAATSATNASSSATAAALTASAAAWVAGTYALNAAAISPLDGQTYRNFVSAGVRNTDPKNDPINWVKLGAPAELWIKGADIASAATVNLTTATGDYVHVTGTTTITAITIASGLSRTTVFDGALTLTNSANLILLGGANITTEAGDIGHWVGDGVAARMTGFERKSGAQLSALPCLYVRDEKASGTAGGTSVGATITQTRTLNTVAINTIAGASLASDSLTVPAGTYSVRGRAPAHESAGKHKAFLYNATDATYALVGSNAQPGGDSMISGVITITAAKTFAMRHWTVTGVVWGLGEACGTGQAEVYSELMFEKVA